MTHLSYAERISGCINPISRKLLALMSGKETNLAVSLDVTRADQLLRLAKEVGPHICVLKTHIDIIEDFSSALVEELKSLAQEYGFFIFEDRKFADIGNTVKLQYSSGIYRIADWAEITNAHLVSGPGVVAGLKEGAGDRQRGLLLLAQMSSAGNRLNRADTAAAVTWAEADQNFIMGFICTERLSFEPGLIHFSPGCQLAKGGDELGQVYRTPAYLIDQCGSDVIIVGRGIYQDADPGARAAEYRRAGWDAYLSRSVVRSAAESSPHF